MLAVAKKLSIGLGVCQETNPGIWLTEQIEPIIAPAHRQHEQLYKPFYYSGCSSRTTTRQPMGAMTAASLFGLSNQALSYPHLFSFHRTIKSFEHHI